MVPRVVDRAVEPASTDGGVFDELIRVVHEIMRQAGTVERSDKRQQAGVVLIADEVGSSSQPLALALNAQGGKRRIPLMSTSGAQREAHRCRLRDAA